jgi:large subunit ribosomal protein L18e
LKRNSSRLLLASSFHKLSRSTKAGLWEDVSRKLYGSRQNRRSINVGEIERFSKDDSSVVVAGKVLGGGNISHKVTVAAFSFSKEAREKIMKSGGRCLNLSEIGDGKEMPSKGVIVLG